MQNSILSPLTRQPHLPTATHHVRLARVVQSICSRCSKTIAFSSSVQMLSLAEKAHKCASKSWLGPS